MKNHESSEKMLGARLGARLAVALALTAIAGGYFYWQKQREAPRALTATEQTIQEQLKQENPQSAVPVSVQSASVLLAFSATGTESAVESADVSHSDLQALLGEINRLLQDIEFARETLDTLGDTQTIGGAWSLDSQNLWVIKGEPYQVAAKKLANALTASGNPDSNLIKLSLNTDRPAKLKEVLDLHAKRLVQKWKTNRDSTKTTLSNLLAEKEGLELEVTNAVSKEKSALTKTLLSSDNSVELSAMRSQRLTLLEKIKVLDIEARQSQPNRGSTAYSTHSHRVLINRLQDQQAYLQTQSNQADGNPEIKTSIDTELKKVSAQLTQLIEQEKQTQSLAEGLADNQQIDSNAKKLKALQAELNLLDRKIKAADMNASKGSLTDLKTKTESLMKKLEVVEGKIKAASKKPELRFGLELYQ